MSGQLCRMHRHKVECGFQCQSKTFFLASLLSFTFYTITNFVPINPLNAELNPTCHLMALLGVHHFFHVSRIRVKSLTLRLLMSYIYIYIYDISSLRVKMFFEEFLYRDYLRSCHQKKIIYIISFIFPVFVGGSQ